MISISKIKNNLSLLLIFCLLIIIFLQRCSFNNKNDSTPRIVRDTVWVKNDTVIVSKPQIVKTIPVKITEEKIIKEYIPDSNYPGLLRQYEGVIKSLLAKNVTEDKIQIDSNGYIMIFDTVQNNMIVARSSKVSIKYPVIKETITKPAPKVVQLYAGGQISGNPANLVNGINAGLLVKNKRDQIYGVSVGVNNTGNISYGVQSYWKIKFRN